MEFVQLIKQEPPTLCRRFFAELFLFRFEDLQ